MCPSIIPSSELTCLVVAFTAKIGMLPKRPVSLAGTSPTQSRSNTLGANADEDELDYVENPFEEEKK